MTFKSIPCQLTQAAHVTTGELHVVTPATKATSALLGHVFTQPQLCLGMLTPSQGLRAG